MHCAIRVVNVNQSRKIVLFKRIFPYNIFVLLRFAERFYFTSFNSNEIGIQAIHWSKWLFNWSLIDSIFHSFHFISFWTQVLSGVSRIGTKKINWHVFHYLLIYRLSSFSNEVNLVNLFTIFSFMNGTLVQMEHARTNARTHSHSRTSYADTHTAWRTTNHGKLRIFISKIRSIQMINITFSRW